MHFQTSKGWKVFEVSAVWNSCGVLSVQMFIAELRARLKDNIENSYGALITSWYHNAPSHHLVIPLWVMIRSAKLVNGTAQGRLLLADFNALEFWVFCPGVDFSQEFSLVIWLEWKNLLILNSIPGYNNHIIPFEVRAIRIEFELRWQNHDWNRPQHHWCHCEDVLSELAVVWTCEIQEILCAIFTMERSWTIILGPVSIWRYYLTSKGNFMTKIK